MTKIKYALALILFLFAVITSTDLRADANVEGTVTDLVTGLPIQGALVELIRGSQVRASDITNIVGLYQINNVEPSNYTMVVSAPGYQTKSFGAKLNNNTTTLIDVSLVPNGGTISGTVTDDNTTNPISGATIRLFQGPSLLALTSTNLSGNYSFPDLAPGSYIVVASATGYGAAIKGAEVTIGATTIVDFALKTQQGTIAGTVTDAVTTNPIQGATVTILSGSTIVAAVDTDAGGNYSVAGLAPGNYIVVASASSYQTQSVGATVISGNTTTVDFALASNPGTIQGTVIRADTGTPISGATIAIFQQFNFIGSVLTSPDGTYSFPGLASGNYTVVANAANFQIQAAGTTVTSNAITIVNFMLNPNPGSIQGTVIDSVTSGPIPGATISVLNGPIVIATAITDSNGNYDIPNITPDDYSVMAQAVGYQSMTIAASVSSNNTTTVNFALNPFPGSISGTVTDAVTTDPIEGATVAIFQGTTLISFALTDVNGDYSIPDLAPGNYTIVAKATGYQIAYTSALVIANVTTIVDFALQNNPGAITGIVTDQCSGSGVSGALVIVLDGTSIVAFGITDSNGQYIIDSLGPNNYTVTVVKQNYVVASSLVTVTAGNTTIANFILTPNALPPTSISGKAYYDKFLTQKERVHCITWTPSPSGCTTEYQVFRNGSLVAVIPSSAPLSYCDHNRNNQQDTYSVRAINMFGQMSAFVTITLK